MKPNSGGLRTTDIMDTTTGRREETACAQRGKRGKIAQGNKAEEQSDVQERRGVNGRRKEREKKKKVDSVTARESDAR